MNNSNILTITVGLSIAILFVVEALPAVSSNHISSQTEKKITAQNKNGDSRNLKPVSGLIENVRSISTAERKTNEETKTNGDDNPYRWPPTSGWAIVFITIAYVIVSFLQLCAIRRQATIAQQALTTAERAWVCVGFERSYILGDGSIDLCIFNTGKSVGHIKDIQLFGFDVVDKGTPIPDNPTSVQPPGLGTWSIFPGENTIQRWNVRLDPTSIPYIIAETKLLRIHGFVQYTDIFGKGHATKFYRVWMEDVGQNNGKFMIPPDAAPGQNEAT